MERHSQKQSPMAIVFHGYKVMACAAAACVPFVGMLQGISEVGGAPCVTLVVAVEAVVAVVPAVVVAVLMVTAVEMVAVTVAQVCCGFGGMVLGLCAGAAWAFECCSFSLLLFRLLPERLVRVPSGWSVSVL